MYYTMNSALCLILTNYDHPSFYRYKLDLTAKVNKYLILADHGSYTSRQMTSISFIILKEWQNEFEGLPVELSVIPERILLLIHLPSQYACAEILMSRRLKFTLAELKNRTKL